MTHNVATRSELLARRARIALAGQGRDLLTEKRTALVAELRALGAEVLSGLHEPSPAPSDPPGAPPDASFRRGSPLARSPG